MLYGKGLATEEQIKEFKEFLKYKFEKNIY